MKKKENKKERELPKLDVPEKYQPYKGVSREIREVGVPIICPIIFGIGIIGMIISMVILW